MTSLKDLKKGQHVHLMGICGTAMASLAGLLKDRGFKITGSDQNPYPPMSTQLEKLGITIQKGYQASNLTPKPDFVIIGNVISKNNPEAEECARLGLPYTSLPQALGEFVIDQRESIVIAGTHGKTTTTSMMAWTTDVVGLKPGFLIGGIPKNYDFSFRNPGANHFVIEGDEYDTAYFDKVPKFVHYRPKHVIFTSCEFDHADIYKDFDAVKSAFRRLMTLIPENGTLIYWGEDKNVAALGAECKAKKRFSYGIKSGDYRAELISQDIKQKFYVQSPKGEKMGPFEIHMSGDYNLLNATAVIGLAEQSGWPMDKVTEALKTFQGVKRRQEILGEPKGILVIEDFAHHPTAVRETIKGVKKQYPQRNLFAVFEPRSATSRRKVFQKDYAEAFEGAEYICLANAFDQTKIDTENRFSSAELVADLKAKNKNAKNFDTADEIVSYLGDNSKKGDLILIMSNGGFDGIYGKLLKRLEA
ncbi:MAG: UDP-N-acetylmuramate:L-alanyl-gamma-D-glutamyl-meso-diaminopimelate ligase [Pseudobdellovibrionaceae bacterium]